MEAENTEGAWFFYMRVSSFSEATLAKNAELAGLSDIKSNFAIETSFPLCRVSCLRVVWVQDLAVHKSEGISLDLQLTAFP